MTAGSRRFFVLQGKFFAKKSGPESARMCARIHMRPPRHQSRERSEARGLCCLPARRLWNHEEPCRTREGNPLARLNVPSANAGMTTPASRASRRSLRPLTRSIALRIHPLETLTTTAPQIRSRSSTTDQKPRALPDLRTHRNPRFPPSS